MISFYFVAKAHIWSLHAIERLWSFHNWKPVGKCIGRIHTACQTKGRNQFTIYKVRGTAHLFLEELFSGTSDSPFEQSLSRLHMEEYRDYQPPKILSCQTARNDMNIATKYWFQGTNTPNSSQQSNYHEISPLRPFLKGNFQGISH